MFVGQYVCPSTFGNSARTAGPRARRGTIRHQNAGTMVPIMSRTWHMAHVKACNNFRTALQVKRWGPLISNLQVTRRLQLKIRTGCSVPCNVCQMVPDLTFSRIASEPLIRSEWERQFDVFRPREDDGAYRESICGTWHMLGTLLIFSLFANNVS